MYIDKLDDIVNKYNNTYHRTIKMKPAHVKQIAYINSSKEINVEDPKLKICDIARISKYKNIFAKGYALIWSEDVLVIKKVENTMPWTFVVSELKDEQILETLYKKICKKQMKNSLKFKK